MTKHSESLVCRVLQTKPTQLLLHHIEHPEEVFRYSDKLTESVQLRCKQEQPVMICWHYSLGLW